MIYFLRSGYDGPIKIGKVNMNERRHLHLQEEAVQNRIKLLQTGNPERLLLLKTVRSIDVGVSESELHKNFFHLNIHGEWFAPEKELLEYIERL